jgi:WD40 repeat protein
VSYARDGKLVTCGRDNAVTLWDGTGKKLRDLEKYCDLPLRAVFSSDGVRVFVSDFDGRVAAWTVKDGRRVGNLDADPLSSSPKLATTQNASQVWPSVRGPASPATK